MDVISGIMVKRSSSVNILIIGGSFFAPDDDAGANAP